MNILIFLAIPAVIFLAGCINLPNASTQSAAYDCGTNTQCFQTYLKQCAPAKVIADPGAAFQGYTGSGPQMVMYTEVKSGTPEACRVYMRFEDLRGENLPVEMQAQLDALKGTDMTCTLQVNRDPIPTPDISKCSGTMLNNEFVCKYFQLQWGSLYCSQTQN